MIHVCGSKGRPGEDCLDPEACRTKIPDGKAMLEMFMKKHGLKNKDHALALMAIEVFNPDRKAP